MAFGTASMVQRGVESAHATFSDLDNGERPGMGYLLVMLTLIAFCVLIFAFEYPYCILVSVLTTIESSQADAYIPVDTLPPDDEDDGMPKPPSTPDTPLQSDVLVTKDIPITSSIRRTIKHLRAHYGRLSCFRGLSLFLCILFARGFIAGLLGRLVFRNPLVSFCVAPLLADLLLARWEMTWLHIIISEPTEKRWWRRAPPLKTWLKIAPAVGLRSVAQQLVTICCAAVLLSLGIFQRMLDPECKISRGELYAVYAQLFLLVILSSALMVVFVLPAFILVVRVAASMLPEENKAVVPFDRSFGGMATPAVTGGQGGVGMVEAWKSFDRPSRIRLLKNVAKAGAIWLALQVVLLVVWVGEVHLVYGTQKIQEIFCAVGKIRT